MPPTHSSQADVAAAYRTLIAHETEPKEQDFYRTRLQRLEQATEPVCGFDCRSRVAAAGVGVYCPQCSAKSADTDLATQLAIQQIEGEAAWWRSIDFDRNASRTFESMTGDSQQAVRTGVERVLAHLASTGRLIPAGGMALTAKQVVDVKIVLGQLERGGPAFEAAHERLRALFPATEPAEDAPCAICNVNETNHAGVSYYHPFTTEPGPFDDEGNDRPDPPEPAEEEGVAREWPSLDKVPYDVKVTDGAGREWRWAQGCWRFTCSDGSLSRYRGEAYELGVPPFTEVVTATPAEPAEEETKAEDESGWHWVQSAGGYYSGPACTGGYGCRSMAHYEGCLRPSLTASSPVVPAPNETGPWQTVDAIPESVTRIEDCEGDVWHRCTAGWEHGGLHGPEGYAPFVAAEEG